MHIICWVILHRKKITLRVKSYVTIQLLDPAGLAWCYPSDLRKKKLSLSLSSWLRRISFGLTSAKKERENFHLYIYFLYYILFFTHLFASTPRWILLAHWFVLIIKSGKVLICLLTRLEWVMLILRKLWNENKWEIKLSMSLDCKKQKRVLNVHT